MTNRLERAIGVENTESEDDRVKALITGATGFIGYHVAKKLVEESISVRALVRRGSDVSALKRLGVELVEGDIRSFESIKAGLEGCEQVYHLAADYRLWVPNPAEMYEINVKGTKNVMQAALAYGINRVIYTSSVGVWAGEKKEQVLDEASPSDFSHMVGHYKKSKYLAEQEVYRYHAKGLPVVIVNPATPVGPDDRKPTPTGQVIVDFMKGKIPAYLNTGLNFVDVSDVADGHFLASVKGEIGQRYILGHENLTLQEFFTTLVRITGRAAPKIRLPYYPVLALACFNEALSAWVIKTPPRIPLTGVRMAKRFMFFSSQKAVRKLNMPQHPVEGALKRAVRWYTEEGYLED